MEETQGNLQKFLQESEAKARGSLRFSPLYFTLLSGGILNYVEVCYSPSGIHDHRLSFWPFAFDDVSGIEIGPPGIVFDIRFCFWPSTFNYFKNIFRR